MNYKKKVIVFPAGKFLANTGNQGSPGPESPYSFAGPSFAVSRTSFEQRGTVFAIIGSVHKPIFFEGGRYA